MDDTVRKLAHKVKESTEACAGFSLKYVYIEVNQLTDQIAAIANTEEPFDLNLQALPEDILKVANRHALKTKYVRM